MMIKTQFISFIWRYKLMLISALLMTFFYCFFVFLPTRKALLLEVWQQQTQQQKINLMNAKLAKEPTVLALQNQLADLKPIQNEPTAHLNKFEQIMAFIAKQNLLILEAFTKPDPNKISLSISGDYFAFIDFLTDLTNASANITLLSLAITRKSDALFFNINLEGLYDDK